MMNTQEAMGEQFWDENCPYTAWCMSLETLEPVQDKLFEEADNNEPIPDKIVAKEDILSKALEQADLPSTNTESPTAPETYDPWARKKTKPQPVGGRRRAPSTADATRNSYSANRAASNTRPYFSVSRTSESHSRHYRSDLPRINLPRDPNQQFNPQELIMPHSSFNTGVQNNNVQANSIHSSFNTTNISSGSINLNQPNAAANIPQGPLSLPRQHNPMPNGSMNNEQLNQTQPPQPSRETAMQEGYGRIRFERHNNMWIPSSEVHELNALPAQEVIKHLNEATKIITLNGWRAIPAGIHTAVDNHLHDAYKTFITNVLSFIPSPSNGNLPVKAEFEKLCKSRQKMPHHSEFFSKQK